MNSSKEKIENFVLFLSEIYNKDISTKLNFYVSILSQELQNLNLGRLSNQIVKQSKFFPSIAEILEIANRKPKTTKQIAEEFVDKAIHLFTNEHKTAHAELGSEGYTLAKEIGLNPYDIKTGQQNPKFERSVWVERALRAFDKKTNEGNLLSSPGDAKNIMDEIQKRTDLKLIKGEK